MNNQTVIKLPIDPSEILLEAFGKASVLLLDIAATMPSWVWAVLIAMMVLKIVPVKNTRARK